MKTSAYLIKRGRTPILNFKSVITLNHQHYLFISILGNKNYSVIDIIEKFNDALKW